MIKQSYSLRDFANITGIDANTMRVWKKRYGILESGVAASGTAQYSQQDLKYILQIKLLLESGMRISDIIGMSRDERMKMLQTRFLSKSVSRYQEIEKLLFEAVFELDEEKLHACYYQLLAETSFSEAMKEFLLPFLNRCGKLWELDTVNTIQEHFISNFIRKCLVIATDRMPYNDTDVDYALFLPEPELHEIPLLLANYLLRESGRKTLYLGYSVPYEELDILFKSRHFSYAVTGWLVTMNMNLHWQRMMQLIEGNPSIHFYVYLPQDSQFLHKDHRQPSNITFFNTTEDLENLTV